MLNRYQERNTAAIVNIVFFIFSNQREILCAALFTLMKSLFPALITTGFPRRQRQNLVERRKKHLFAMFKIPPRYFGG